MLLDNQSYTISQLLDEMEVIAGSTVDSIVMAMQPFEHEEKGGALNNSHPNKS